MVRGRVKGGEVRGSAARAEVRAGVKGKTQEQGRQTDRQGTAIREVGSRGRGRGKQARAERQGGREAGR